MTPLEQLRAAAHHARELAEAASPGPWRAVDCRSQKGGQIRVVPAKGDYIANVRAADPNAYIDSAHITAWHPAVTALVAKWLEAEAEYEEDSLFGHRVRGASPFAVAVARAFLDRSRP